MADIVAVTGSAAVRAAAAAAAHACKSVSTVDIIIHAMATDYLARKSAKKNRKREAEKPKRERKKKQARRLCRGEVASLRKMLQLDSAAVPRHALTCILSLQAPATRSPASLPRTWPRSRGAL